LILDDDIDTCHVSPRLLGESELGIKILGRDSPFVVALRSQPRPSCT
jgi:hypothetical protein